MAVPSSGEISLGKIRQELESTSTSNDYDNGPYTSAATAMKAAEIGTYDTINTSNASGDRPNNTSPYSMSEWYSYDHNASGGLAAGSYGNSSSTIVWSGDQGSSTAAIVDSFDISSAAFCGQSAIGETGHVYFRIVSTSGYRQDAQILAVNQSGYGYNNIGKTSGTWGYANWYGTRQTTNTTYNHSTGWYAIAAGSTAGRWNRDTAGTPSGNTGVNVDTFSSDGCIYYEGSSGGYNYDVYLRSPSFTFNTNTIAVKSYGYGANMGTLYMGVYIT